MKVYIVSKYKSPVYERMFTSRGHEIVDNINDADALQFTGGEDVDPSLYKCQRHDKTFFNVERDAYDTFFYNHGLDGGKLLLGICRGAQFLNVKNGGKMYQHVDNHTSNHRVLDLFADELIMCTSTHHQMMIPDEKKCVTRGVVLNTLCETRQFVDCEGFIMEGSIKEMDYEVIMYPETKSLCFQPHPEFPTAPKECTDWYFRLVDEMLQNKFRLQDII